MKRIANLKTDHFIIWDTSLDAPATKIMSAEEMAKYINSWPQEDFFQQMEVRKFLELLERAKEWGVSTQLIGSAKPEEQVRALIEGNRAKDLAENYKWEDDEDNSEMTLEEIIKYWS